MFNGLLNKFRNKTATLVEQVDEENLTSDTKWRPGDMIMERYLVEDIFSGAMGRVFIAEHLGWKVKMAIKVPKPQILAYPEGMQRILTEANSWVEMGMHPNIATCYYVLNIDETPYIFIEYVDGGDLSSWIKAGRCRNMRTALSLAIQFCHGMEFTHSHGIIHRDIKPGNVLISKDAFLKITDFGIIQTRKEAGSAEPLSMSDSETTVGFRGTPGYASPEQFVNSHNIDYRSDIFSFGICLWLMFCGHRPYENNAVPQMTEPRPQEQQDPFPPEFADLLKKVVAPSPDDRHQSFIELRHALNSAHIALYKVPCPHMDLDVSSLQADNLNNRAVSFLELGQKDEAEKCLQKSLDIDDTLSEAIFNYTLFKWQKGASPDRLLKQMDASRKRQPKAKMLDTLTQAIKCDLNRDFWADDGVLATPQKNYFPEYLLCRPKSSVAIFQKSQLKSSIQANIKYLLKAKKYEECSKILFDMWHHDRFKKDTFSLKVYEQLQKIAKQKKPVAVVRMKTVRGNRQAPEKLFYLPGLGKLCTLCNQELIFGSLINSSKTPQQSQHKSVNIVAISQDRQYLAVGHTNGKLTVLESKSSKIIASFDENLQATALCLNQDNSSLSVGYADGSIKQLPLPKSNGKPFTSHSGEKAAITTIIQFHKGDDYITGNSQGDIIHWQGHEKEPLRIIKAHKHPITALAAAPNDLFFISGEDGPELKIWDRQTGQCMKTIIPHEGLSFSFMITSDGRHFITASNDDIIKFWDVATGEALFILDGRGDGITAITTGPSPNIFLTGTQDGSIIIWMIIYELEFS